MEIGMKYPPASWKVIYDIENNWFSVILWKSLSFEKLRSDPTDAVYTPNLIMLYLVEITRL